MNSICWFDQKENRHYFYRGKDCIEIFCKKLKKLATKLVNFEEKEMVPLADRESKFYDDRRECPICKKEFCHDRNEENKFKLYQKVRDHCHYTGKFRGAAQSICNLRYNLSKEIPVVFHNGSTYDHHFIIKHLPEEFKSQFEWLGENTEKIYYFFSTN